MSQSRVLGTVLTALAIVLSSVGASAGGQVETLWRGVFKGDSLFVRAAWISTVGSASCYQNETSEAETSELRRKYIEYRIEDVFGGVWRRGVLSEPDSQQFCCDELAAEATTWPGRLMVKLTAQGWYCEPAGNCSASRFIHVAGPDSVAESAWSNWDDVPWDPASGSYFDGSVTEGCFQYAMRLEALVQGDVLEFRPMFPPAVHEGELLEKEVNKDEGFSYCLRPFNPKKPTSVDWYRTSESKAPERLIIQPGESIEIVSAVIRAERSEGGRLAPRIFRVGVQVAGRRGFLMRADLKALGFVGL